MSEENAPQKERFLQEVEQKLLRKELDARLLNDGLIHIRWNEKPLCSVDRDGIVRFRPADITGPEVDRQLRTVMQTATQAKEYMRVASRGDPFMLRSKCSCVISTLIDLYSITPLLFPEETTKGFLSLSVESTIKVDS